MTHHYPNCGKPHPNWDGLHPNWGKNLSSYLEGDLEGDLNSVFLRTPTSISSYMLLSTRYRGPLHLSLRSLYACTALRPACAGSQNARRTTPFRARRVSQTIPHGSERVPNATNHARKEPRALTEAQRGRSSPNGRRRSGGRDEHVSLQMTSARDECAHSIRSVTTIAARMPVARQDPTCGVRERRVDACRSTRNLWQ